MVTRFQVSFKTLHISETNCTTKDIKTTALSVCSTIFDTYIYSKYNLRLRNEIQLSGIEYSGAHIEYINNSM